MESRETIVQERRGETEQIETATQAEDIEIDKQKDEETNVDIEQNKDNESDDFSGSRNESPEDSSGTMFSVPKRYVLAIMMFCGFMNMYAIRVNLNVAIGAMVKPHPVVENGRHYIKEPDFNWDSKLQGIVLGSFYYGYMFLQVPGGYFAMKIGGTKIYGFGVLFASIFTLFTPPAARSSVWALVALRVAEGLSLGVMLPCNHQIWSYWAPRSERTILVTIALAGMNVGTIVTMPLTGLLTKYGFDGGWASVFYCFGVSGILWWVLWMFIIHESPHVHPTISKAEKAYIERNVDVHKAVKLQWKAMLTSAPVWGVILGNVANDWGLYTILICLPLFLMDIMHFNVQQMGFVASLPFLLKAIVGPLGGVVADILRNGHMSTVNVRRLFYIMGAMGAATLIVISGYSTSAKMAVASMCVGVALSGLLHSGYEVNVLDIAPGVSGVVMGISNTAGTITGFLSPLLVGVMTADKKREQWQMVFWITFFLYLAGTILFCILVSGEAQPWALQQQNDSDSSIEDDSL
eukprot:Seg611.11 transcript_id=Seg611.11/GoldUCD/mRNA.D3Y31 product="Vesicular glutamate transporter 1" protein_id=Seg611.11/GoldUCD/D3Y31